jgi:hypothetical protein
MKFLILAILAPLLMVAEEQATLATELAPGLFYTREIAPTPPPAAHGVVYDFRDTDWDESFRSSLDEISAYNRPLAVVLLRTDPAAGWLDALAGRSHRVITLAPIGAPSSPDVAVPATTAEVASALAAIRGGADLADLASPEIAKRRFDEAALVRRHNGAAPSDPPAAAADNDDETTSPSEAEITPDLMLQRALQILQGLNALGRN